MINDIYQFVALCDNTIGPTQLYYYLENKQVYVTQSQAITMFMVSRLWSLTFDKQSISDFVVTVNGLLKGVCLIDEHELGNRDVVEFAVAIAVLYAKQPMCIGLMYANKILHHYEIGEVIIPVQDAREYHELVEHSTDALSLFIRERVQYGKFSSGKQ